MFKRHCEPSSDSIVMCYPWSTDDQIQIINNPVWWCHLLTANPHLFYFHACHFSHIRSCYHLRYLLRKRLRFVTRNFENGTYHPNTRLLGSSFSALKQVNCPAHATTVYLFTWPHSDSDGNIFLFPYVWKSTEHWYRVCTHSGLTYQQYLSSPTNNVGFAFFTDLTTSELPTDSKSKIYMREDGQFTIQRFIALGSKTYCLPSAYTLKLSNSVGANFLGRA